MKLSEVLSAMVAILLLSSVVPALAAERQYPTSGVVFKKYKSISAKHVSEKSGDKAEPEFGYFICIQRDPQNDPYSDNWLVYRQCWDTTREVFEMTSVCDWFIVKKPTVKDRATRPDDRQFKKMRKADAIAIANFGLCK